MRGLIDYDDDPADTAARQWLWRTILGRRTVERAAVDPRGCLKRSFRAGYLIGQRAAAQAAKGE